MLCACMRGRSRLIEAMITLTRSYSDLRRFETFKDRYKYLELKGRVGESTFGFDRWINQQFYTSREWRDLRHHVIVRDLGCDMGVEGFEIHSGLYIHHMNPVTRDQILEGDPSILDPEFLITVTHKTHNAIHYGPERLLPRPLVDRKPGDTTLW